MDNADGIQHYTRVISMTEAVKRKRAALGLSATVYTPDDLAANEAGYLSEAQIAGLQSLAQTRTWSLWRQIAFAAIICVVVPIMTLSDPNGLLWAIVMACLGWLLLATMAINPLEFRSRLNWCTDLRRDTDNGKVQWLRGFFTTSSVRAPSLGGRNGNSHEHTYRLHIKDWTLETDYGTYQSIRPDEIYTIYYTPNSQVVVLVKSQTDAPILSEVERLLVSPTGSYIATEEYIRYLNASFNTSPDDLCFNAEGKLSPNQANLLRQTIRKRLSFWLRYAVIFAVMAITLFSFLTESASDWYVYLLAWLPLNFISGIGLAWELRKIVLDVRQNIVNSVDGRLIRHLSQDKGQQHHFMINGMEFPVNQAQYDLLQHGDPYTVYFTPHSRTLLAIEWLGASPFKPEGSTPAPSQ